MSLYILFAWPGMDDCIQIQLKHCVPWSLSLILRSHSQALTVCFDSMHVRHPLLLNLWNIYYVPDPVKVLLENKID